MSYYWAQINKYDFFIPKADPKDGYENLITVTDSPTIHVYDEKPNRTDALVGGGSGLIETISSWDDISRDDKNGKQFSIAAIADPEASSETSDDLYYLAINFVLVDSGTNLLIIRSILFERPKAISKPITASLEDLAGIFPEVDSVLSELDQSVLIRSAISRARVALESKGFEWAQIREIDDLNLAISYLGLSMAMLGQIRDPGDNWSIRHDEFNQIAVSLLGSIKLRYDSDNSGDVDQNVSAQNTIRVIR